MEVITSLQEMTSWSNSQKYRQHSVALVPTMGFLHDGHCALIRHARSLADRVVVSLFVNPIQFGPGEDFERYPRNAERDHVLAAAAGADLVFLPDVTDMYPGVEKTRVSVKDLTLQLCGAHRPGHFDGVTTVVTKLFHIIKPTAAIFGEKDFQQLAVIRRMVEDLNFDIDIVGHPIVREPDGLAMSSRNVYLSAEERCHAVCLSEAIAQARKLVADGLRDAQELIAILRRNILSHPGAEPEYISVANRHDLVTQLEIDHNTMLFLAVRFGRTRLIDNGSLL